MTNRRELLPNLLEGHITGYFRYRTACDDQANGDITALQKGRALLDAYRVQTCSFCCRSPEFFFSGMVQAMMKKRVILAFVYFDKYLMHS
jgi:hypothetical protein